NDSAFVVEPENVPGPLLGQGAAMNEVFKAIGRASQGRVPVLIEGEPGTGREAVARAIHQASGDGEELFAAVSCNTALDVLLESELFGHIAGAFSGADTLRDGKVKLVEGGTMFLDEIDQLSAGLQGKLLRLVRDQEYTPIGSTGAVSSSVRIICSTAKDLKKEILEKRFREDLFYALSVATIEVPPLRRRSEDIALLVEHLVHKINTELNKNVRQVSREVIDQLTAYSWPGNLRQLENVLMQAAVMVSGDVLTVGQLPQVVLSDAAGHTNGGHDIILDSRDKTLKDLEREYIFKVLSDTGWHKGKTCTILGISRPRLERRIAEFGFTRAL
ncbi:MAG: sigma 54-interacting transcriptional regulator, partial [Halocynthiibacter sp.]